MTDEGVTAGRSIFDEESVSVSEGVVTYAETRTIADYSQIDPAPAQPGRSIFDEESVSVSEGVVTYAETRTIADYSQTDPAPAQPGRSIFDEESVSVSEGVVTYAETRTIADYSRKDPAPQNAILERIYPLTSVRGILTCSMVSLSRTVTQPSFSVSKS